MLRDLAWQATDDLTRAQLAMFLALGDEVGMTEDERRKTLGLTRNDWLAWNDFVADGPLPAEPPLPEMILRIGQAAFAASVMSELRAA